MTANQTPAGPNGKPLPIKRGEAEPFWQGALKHQLMLQRCKHCGEFQWFPRAMCFNCSHEEMEWIKASGRGKVYSFTITYRGPSKAFSAPYVIAMVDLEEGVRVMSNIVQCSVDDVRIDMPVKVTFEDWDSEFSIMQFMPNT